MGVGGEGLGVGVGWGWGGNRHSIDYADNYNDVHWNNYSSAKLCKASYEA